MASFDKKQWGVAALLVLLTVIVCLPALKGGFVWDDDLLLTENPLVHSADGLWQMWLPSAESDYYPITWTTFWLEWRLWGMNAMGYHATNILLHALGALLLWRILERLQVRGAWLAALIFAVHPVNIESVAWISERKNTLSLVFYALTMLAFLRFERAGGWRWYWGSVGLFLLALLSKTSGVALPGVLLVCAWWQRGKIDRKDLLRSVPFFLLAAAFALLTIWSQQWQLQDGAHGVAIDRPLLFRLGAAGHVFWFYVFKVLVPVNLGAVYPLWKFNTVTALFWLPSAAAGAALGVAWWFRSTWGKTTLFALLYCGGMLFPVLGVFNMPYIERSPVVADHLQYLATIGIICLVVAGITRLPRAVVAGLAVAILGALGSLSWNRTLCYRDQVTFWNDTIAKNPQAGKAHYNLALYYDKRRQYDEALAHYTLAVKYNLGQAMEHNNLANVLLRYNRVPEAMAQYAEAIRLKPRFGEIRGNWANALARNGRPDEAIAQFKEAIRWAPLRPEIRHNYGLALVGIGKIPEAIVQFRMALRLNPQYAEAHCNLGNARFAQGRFDDAKAHYVAALRYKPDYAIAHYNWGLVLAKQGRIAEARTHFAEAVRLNPNHPDYRRNLDQSTKQP